ncbi:hypothetical protein AB0D11_44810 [Streptomyces monashensis]|uniref:hypothetical protein n=1 Tax=Streptomyces monashensis TaxID=1678012 RepID=UPI0033D1EF9A
MTQHGGISAVLFILRSAGRNPVSTTAARRSDPDDLHLIEDGLVGVLAFGTLYISNLDLVARLRNGSPVAPADHTTVGVE